MVWRMECRFSMQMPWVQTLHATFLFSNMSCMHIVPLIVPLIVPVIVLLLPREPHFPSFRISVHFPLSRIRMFDHILLISLSLSLLGGSF